MGSPHAARRRRAVARHPQRPPDRLLPQPDDLPALGVDMSRMAIVARWLIQQPGRSRFVAVLP
jgi:hypothetical protein